MTRLRTPALTCALLLVVACGRDDSRDTAALTIPPLPVNIAEQDPPVQRLFQERHEALVAAVGAPETSDGALALLFGELSMVYHAYDFLPEAATGYTTSTELAPGEMRWWYYRAMLEQQGGDTTTALSSLQRALELAPGYVPALVRGGELATEAGDPETGRRLLSQALEIDSRCARALVGLAAIDLVAGETETAIASLERAAGLQPEASGIRYSLAIAHRQAGDLARAREELAEVGDHNLLQTAIQLDDPLSLAVVDLRIGGREHELRGLRALNAGKYSLAAVEFEQAMAIDPDRVYARHGLGSALLAMDRLEEAATAFEELLAAEPTHAESRVALARVRRRQGRLDEAERLARQVTTSDPVLATAHALLGQVLQQQGDASGAVAAFDRALDIDPDDVEVRFHRLMALAVLSPSRAQSTLAKDTRLLPGNAVLELASARLALSADIQGQRAALASACAVAARAPSPAAAETVALLSARLGQREVAARWLSLARDSAPGGPPPWSDQRSSAFASNPNSATAWYPHERLILTARQAMRSPGAPC